MKKQYRKATLPLIVGKKYYYRGVYYATNVEAHSAFYIGPTMESDLHGVFDVRSKYTYQQIAYQLVEEEFTPQTLFVLFTKYKDDPKYYAACYQTKEEAEPLDKLYRATNRVGHSFITEVEVPC